MSDFTKYGSTVTIIIGYVNLCYLAKMKMVIVLQRNILFDRVPVGYLRRSRKMMYTEISVLWLSEDRVIEHAIGSNAVSFTSYQVACYLTHYVGFLMAWNK